MSGLPSENFGSINGGMDVSLVQIMIKYVFGNSWVYSRIIHGQSLGFRFSDQRQRQATPSILN